jgi:hydroxyacyl-ACP dehydratase HTD2-like protein with hotdog domain
MAYITRRLFTATCCRQTSAPHSHTSAAEACSELLTRYQKGPISIRKQVFDANQLQLLSITVGRTPTSFNPPPQGTPIPPGYHLVYFTPSILESELGLDGTDRTVNPLALFTRRMWAGGKLTWSQDRTALLRVGQEVRETTKVLSAEPKKLKNGGEMLVVGVEKTFSNEHGVALTDRRNWVFQPALTPENPLKAPSRPEENVLPSGKHQRDFVQTPTSLFRFSALTFNAHKIHYLPEWCREVEGHREVVVHGPLNLVNMLDLWRDVRSDGNSEAVPRSIAYRAMSPLYAGEKYRILLEQIPSGNKTEAGEEWKAEIWDSFGKQSMKGTIME